MYSLYRFPSKDFHSQRFPLRPPNGQKRPSAWRAVRPPRSVRHAPYLGRAAEPARRARLVQTARSGTRAICRVGRRCVARPAVAAHGGAVAGVSQGARADPHGGQCRAQVRAARVPDGFPIPGGQLSRPRRPLPPYLCRVSATLTPRVRICCFSCLQASNVAAVDRGGSSRIRHERML